MVGVRGGTGLLGVEARGLIKHQPHCRGAPEGPHQGARLAAVLLHSAAPSAFHSESLYERGQWRRERGSCEKVLLRYQHLKYPTVRYKVDLMGKTQKDGMRGTEPGKTEMKRRE